MTQLQKAVRNWIDSIKDEPWYDVDYDDIILEAWQQGASWLSKKLLEENPDGTVVVTFIDDWSNEALEGDN